MTSPARTDPAISSVSPYLGYPDGDAAAEWLQRVLGFGPARSVRDERGGWYEGEMFAGATTVHLSGGSAMAPRTGAGALLIVHVTDVDAQYRRMVDVRADVELQRDEAYGPRTCHVTGPWVTGGTSGRERQATDVTTGSEVGMAW